MILSKMKRNQYIVWIFNIATILIIFLTIFSNFFPDRISSYYNYKDYYYQNDFREAVYYDGVTEIIQDFEAKGNILSNISLFFGDMADAKLYLELINEKSKVIAYTEINLSDYRPNTWNTIAVDCEKLIRGETYKLRITGNDLSNIALNTSNYWPEIFGTCYVNREPVPYSLAVGMQSTYIYMMLGNGLELFVKLLFATIIAGALSYTILNIKEMFEVFKHTEKKQGFLYALYFAIYTVLLFNPLESIHIQVTEFSRVIGSGLINGEDVLKRVNNFNYWFLYLLICFSLFFLLANYFRTKKCSAENQKITKFLDNLIVLANIIQGFKCINYFYNESLDMPVFYYSEYLLMAVLLIGIVYIGLKLERKLSIDHFTKLMVSVLMCSLPLTILITNSRIFGIQEWDSGRLLMGIQIVLLTIFIIIVKIVNVNWDKKLNSSVLTFVVVCMSFIPLATSFFIELISILNQHEIFLVNVSNIYLYAIIVVFAIVSLFAVVVCKKNICLENWKSIAYPAIIFGVACLWRQLPISAVYSPDLFESANTSILISDFLNFGDIPIVEHYGGHMMSGVWEGIIYGLLNNDYMGAALTPYFRYSATVIAILFFFLVKQIWDENVALLVALFFPFYKSVEYWGLGYLVVLAAIAYVKDNTYKRAVLFWLSLAWCVLYRLDLGAAFAAASIVALALYIISEKNLKAIKQLAISLLAVGGGAGILWCIICIINNVNPINRLFEFFLISASNQNWAYAGIGSNTLSKYAWTYIFVPFAVVLCLVYTVFSKSFKNSVHKESWILILVLGFSFVFNYSRGLVRHSLVETALNPIMWTAYTFFAVFVASVIKNGKLFLPTFTIFVLCNSLFLSDNNFSERSIADYSVERIGTFTETWKLDRFAEDNLRTGGTVKTYWKQIQDNQEIIARIKVDKNLEKIINKYQVIMDALLKEGETFVDFINKTFIYSAINRQNPVYVSQSPLQLSGEFTQEEFIKEIAGVPIVLMPLDAENFRNSEALDGVANVVRYYKIAEYIFQNYIPLCAYEDEFAVWCLPERYGEMVKKVEALSAHDIELKDNLLLLEDMSRNHSEIVSNADGSLNINFTGVDPNICDVQKLFDLTPYIDSEIKIVIDYKTDVAGPLEIFYTVNEGENYTENNKQSVAIESEGTAYFTIPITQWTRLRFDTPEGSKVTIKSFKIDVYDCNLIDYGYDGPYPASDGVTYSYLPYMHNYSVDELPRIWAEGDKKDSVNNTVVAQLDYDMGVYRFNSSEIEPGKDGNYLKVSMKYTGNDRAGKYKSDDETTNAVLKLGNYEDGKFEIKYLYNFSVKEGEHEYMFRISNDYYWYLKQVDAVILECGESLIDVDMAILQGD